MAAATCAPHRRQQATTFPSTATIGPRSFSSGGEQPGVALPNIITARLHPTNSPNTEPSTPQPLTHLYVISTTSLVRAGFNATIEPPAIRSEIVSVCTSAERARDVARIARRQAFAWVVPEDRVGEFDGVGMERMFGSGRVEVFWMGNREFVEREGDVEVRVLEGEMRVGVDCGEGGNAGGGGSGTPASE